MNEEVKTLWVSSLRSGDYYQGRYNLKTEDKIGDKFCCLGVLCDLHDKHFDCEQSFSSLSGGLPDHVRIWAELSDAFPYVRKYGSRSRTTLSFLNDIEKFNFNQIADLIEQQL